MSKLLFTILCCLVINFSFAQDSEEIDKRFFVFDTYEDFKNNEGRYIGLYHAFNWYWRGNMIRYEVDNAGEDMRVNDFWGFRIGDYYFRNKTAGPNIPVEIILNKDKVFYLDGYIRLKYLAGEEEAYLRSEKAVFYSDDFESKIYTIDKLIKKEDKNAALSSLIPCLKKAKERYGYQAQFNNYVECLGEFSPDSKPTE